MKTIYAGLDIAKPKLDLHLQGQNFTFKNQPAGHRQLVRGLRQLPGPLHVVAEASVVTKGPSCSLCRRRA